MKRLISALVIVCLIALTGCGIRLENEPRGIDLPPITRPEQPSPEPGPLPVTLYFVRDNRLHPVERSVANTSEDAVLALLLAGPTSTELTAGMRTALANQDLRVSRDTTTGIAVVSVTAELANTSGTNQLLAVAQLVWTITALPGTDRVRLIFAGQDLEVPTDQGLSKGPVTRSDYLSTAPLNTGDAARAPAGPRPTTTGELSPRLRLVTAPVMGPTPARQ